MTDRSLIKLTSDIYTAQTKENVDREAALGFRDCIGLPLMLSSNGLPDKPTEEVLV